MARKKRGFPLFFLLVAAALVAGYFVFWTHSVSAGDIRRDPRAYAGREVAVSGMVVGGASLGGTLFRALGGGGSFFLLDDGTGQIGVLGAGPAPAKGRRVTVRGKVEVLASVSIPNAWLKMLGVLPEGGGELTAVVIRAAHLRVH